MSVVLNLTESQTLIALRAFLLAVLPAGVEVVKAQVNRVPQPKSTDFVMMTPTLRERLETNVTSVVDPYPAPGGARADRQATRVTVQLDIHGPNSAENVQIVSTLFRSDYATTQFATSGFDVTPLYASDPHQMPFVNAEQQVESRWTIDVAMQCNPVVTTPQDFAARLGLGIINVDVVYPPGP